MKSYRFIVRGLVQGVYYRKSVLENALKEKFSGYVKNLPDGTVEVAVTCSGDRLEKFISILRAGSAISEVYNIEQYEDKNIYSSKFEIRY